jgi:hypothetical protein
MCGQLHAWAPSAPPPPALAQHPAAAAAAAEGMKRMNEVMNEHPAQQGAYHILCHLLCVITLCSSIQQQSNAQNMPKHLICWGGYMTAAVVFCLMLVE